MTMSKVDSGYVTLWSSSGTLVTYYQTQTLLMCARRCLGDGRCKAIAYDQGGLTCSLGECIITQPVARNPSDGVYQTPQKFCDSTPGFKVETNGHTSACLWWSDTKKNFADASQDCKTKGSILATFKTWEKFQILQQKASVTTATYIGLDDIDVEGVFRWHGDRSVLDSSYELQIFRSGEPNNADNNEDCIAVWSNELNDNPSRGSTFQNVSMSKVDNPYTKLWTSSPTTFSPTRSITECARRCFERNSTCGAIAYEENNSTCTLAKGSILATFKSWEKFQLLKQKNVLNNNHIVYIGLDDMDVEGVFRWHDDGSVLDLNSSYSKQIFSPG
ncbi:hypothetical protein Btru_012534 [Bulinus truncatus]|nr:hypothetical protein Btru_012534 [Bulinus truncatus]